MFILWILFVSVFVFAILSSLDFTRWKRADLLAFFYVKLSCVFVTFKYGVLGQVWYFIVSIPDHCLLPYFEYSRTYRFFTFLTNDSSFSIIEVIRNRRNYPFMYMYVALENEPRHEISNNVVCGTSKGSDQLAHMRSLIRAFASRLNIYDC